MSIEMLPAHVGDVLGEPVSDHDNLLDARLAEQPAIADHAVLLGGDA